MHSPYVPSNCNIGNAILTYYHIKKAGIELGEMPDLSIDQGIVIIRTGFISPKLNPWIHQDVTNIRQDVAQEGQHAGYDQDAQRHRVVPLHDGVEP